jgi:hypothetical protein
VGRDDARIVGAARATPRTFEAVERNSEKE